MKTSYVLSIVAAGVISTIIGTGFVAAQPSANVGAESVTAQSGGSLELLKAQSESSATTWRRPL